MIRAAADGDAHTLERLLAEGAQVNDTNPGGQTALILAALMGRSDIVRLLLQAGADVRLRDSHGLTAIDWAQRKGLSNITQLLVSYSRLSSGDPQRPTLPRDPTLPSIQTETIRRSPTETPQKTTSDPSPRASTEASPQEREGWGPARIAIKKSMERQAKQDIEPAAHASIEERAKIEERPSPPASAETQSSDADLWWPERLRETRSDQTLPTEPETLRARMETERIFEQARLRVEEEVRRKTEIQSRSTLEGELVSAPKAAASTANIKRCPKCNTIYENDTRTYCAYDAGRLISIDEVPMGPGAHSFSRPTLWVMVASTLFGSVLVTYLITNYLAGEDRADPGAGAATEVVTSTDETVPVVGGALIGKEIELPKPEYTAEARSAGLTGVVTVAVRVNQKGRVISARALNGDLLLRTAAVNAARKATFSSERLAREGQIVTGTISYTFKP